MAARSLEQALFAILKADSTLSSLLGGLRLYDEPRRDSAYPYLTLATSYSRDRSTGTERGEEHRILITVWAGSRDRKLLQDILARLRVILDDPALSLADHHLVLLMIERFDIRADRKNRLSQGILQLRAVTEDLPS
ncbi:DUF3168 domain-containing protein [Cohaesibacter sp. ES.047]|uniref:DUF3168 domain-containing protein n=1 Tax=Cohaesibacter sp. ES.047 TaxID=1798205 RepID=UPI0012FE6132|nr:DUF3168 domain-containing protein [Cohaesibacter sp. ES.047]